MNLMRGVSHFNKCSPSITTMKQTKEEMGRLFLCSDQTVSTVSPFQCYRYPIITKTLQQQVLFCPDGHSLIEVIKCVAF